jgi:signal transduction histidine kinase
VTVTPSAVLLTLLWALLAAGAMWLVGIPLRRRGFFALALAVSLTGTAAALGALLGAVQTMLLPSVNEAALLAIGVGAAAIGVAAAAAAARRLVRDNRRIRADVAALAEGRVPTAAGRPLTGELENTRSELRRTAEQLSASRDRERALESSRRELVAWVSHDLRTPLAGLRAMAESLEDGVVDDPHTWTKQIAASVDRLARMVDDLFELSRIQARAFRTRREPVALDDLVSDVVAALSSLADASGVLLDGAGDSMAVVDGSADELDRAIANLVLNAVRHTPRGGRVWVEVAAEEPDLRQSAGACAVVSVTDGCGGIPADELHRVFEVGWRGEAERPADDGPAPAGAGLGLAITRGIVEAHGGVVSVDNVPGGCRFLVRLPLAP